MSNSVQPHRWQPTRLPHPWDSPGKNTGVGCHFFLQCMKVKLLSHVQLLVTSWTAAHQAPPSMGFSRQGYWSGVPLLSPNEEMEPKQKQHPVVDGTGDRSKVWFYKEQYCIRAWNVRSMNQGKLKVVKQEMARVNIDILGISELKWTGKAEFNSDDHHIYYCG